tara:strand:- start:1431 stop:1706 length:276 start_codon:yes stop_codon:yes gene_type:complete
MNNTNIITIEKGVEMPPARGYTNHDKYNFVDKMDIGDSFVINDNTPDFSPENTRKHMYLRNARKKSGVKYAVRTISGHSKTPEAIRVWRIR